MINESLDTYRQERKCFILGLKHFYAIDFYSLDRRERTQWLGAYIKSKREFFENLIDYWDETPPRVVKGWPTGYKYEKGFKRTRVLKSLV